MHLQKCMFHLKKIYDKAGDKYYDKDDIIKKLQEDNKELREVIDKLKEEIKDIQR